MHEQIKKRREERIRRLMADPRRLEQAVRPSGNTEEEAWQAWRTPPTLRQFAGKWVICLMLYGAVWTVFQVDHPALVPVRESIRRALTESFRFEAAAAWYHRHVGDLPALMPAFGVKNTEAEPAYTAPVSGLAEGPHRTLAGGIVLATAPDEEVRASGEGLVVQVAETPETGLTVTVRHKAGLETVYGFLHRVRVHDSDWLAAGDVIGTVMNEPDGRAGRLYFAVRQHGRFLPPGDVIPLD